MRLLIVNANTSDIVTGKVARGARAAARPDTTIEAVTGRFGARVIGTRTELAIAEHATVELLARHAKGHDAVVIAVSYDSALRAARELLDIPVVGITEAMLLTGCMLGGRLGIVMFGRRVLPVYEELVASHRLDGRVVGWRALESTAPYGDGDQHEADEQVVQAALSLVEQDRAEVVLLAGAVMAGVPLRLQARVPVPLLDGVSCGVRQAELLASMAPIKPRTGSYAALPARELVQVDPALMAAFAPAPASVDDAALASARAAP